MVLRFTWIDGLTLRRKKKQKKKTFVFDMCRITCTELPEA